MCFQHGQEVKPQSDIADIMGYDYSTLKLVLESFVDEIAEESAELILERPRFVHAIVVVAGEDTVELCHAECIRQLDEIDVQESVQAATPVLDDFMDRIVREISESRDMLDNPHYTKPLLSTPQKTLHQPMYNTHTTNELLRQLNTNNYLHQMPTIQFPSMNRPRGQY